MTFCITIYPLNCSQYSYYIYRIPAVKLFITVQQNFKIDVCDCKARSVYTKTQFSDKHKQTWHNKTVTYVSMTHNVNEAVFCHMSETNNDNICQDHYHVP